MPIEVELRDNIWGNVAEDSSHRLSPELYNSVAETEKVRKSKGKRKGRECTQMKY